ncbi:MAG: hypothetical protein ACI90V_009910 [Bacillariaceae sp.]|jgi:hypothetical protein
MRELYRSGTTICPMLSLGSVSIDFFLQNNLLEFVALVLRALRVDVLL